MDAIYGVFAVLVLFALGWAVTKSKVLGAIFNGIGLAMNWLWGSVFVAGGVWGLFNDLGIWVPIVSIGVGVYFFTTGRFDAKVSAVVDSTVEAVADLAAEKLSGYEGAAADAGAIPAADQPDETLSPTAKLLSTQNLLLVIAAVGIVYGFLGLQDVGEVTMTVNGSGAIDTDTSYGSPLAWVALLGGLAAAAVWQALLRRGRRGQTTAAPSAQRALASLSGLDGQTRKRIGVTLAALVLVVGGVMATNAARAAWNYKLEGDYAQREAEGIAQAETDAQTEQEALEAETDSNGGSAAGAENSSEGEDTTPNGHRRWTQAPDIVGMAPSDGSVQHSMATYTAAGGDRDSFILEIDDISLGGTDPAYIHDVQLFSDEVGSCYVDDEPVSVGAFLEFVGGNAETLGSIEFTQDEIVRSDAYSANYVPADGY